ncbi:hypothetical protein BTS2_1514 [Bacillus sp. TS-2]|nr:hypothetical protein BTS2_1514 [Bacillus sp. TS-2]
MNLYSVVTNVFMNVTLRKFSHGLSRFYKDRKYTSYESYFPCSQFYRVPNRSFKHDFQKNGHDIR